MNPGTPWDATRWREAHRNSLDQNPQLSAPTPRETGRARSVLLGQNQPYQQPWDSTSHRPSNVDKPGPEHVPHADFRRGADASNYRAWSPRNPITRGSLHEGSYTSPSKRLTEPWQYNDYSRRSSIASRTSDPPLTLQIPPHPLDPPRTLLALAATANQPSGQPESQSQPASLPSFASLQNSTSRSHEQGPTSYASAMPEKMDCRACADLKPVIQELATAVAELDETVQARCRRSVTRTSDYPKESPFRVVRWVLDRLESTKGDLQVVEPWSSPARQQQQLGYGGLRTSPSNASPTGAFKRPSDSTDFASMPSLKRPRSGSYSDQFPRSSSLSGGQGDRKMAFDFAPREGPAGVSPPPTDSHPGSAHPRQQSPSIQGRSFRPLPSPSSVAYPPTAASSVAGPAPPSAGSPTTSHHPGSSIHTVSTSSAASQHIADLQHQITLKSLSLQTLQTEYSSLLQKFQRERTKTQAIEKKTSVADKEVNDLIGKNEDLTEQVRSLETSVEELEKKRDAERADAAKEKEQYGRMLDMSGRINVKNAEDRKKLVDEKAQLERRVMAYERESEVRLKQMKSSFNERLDAHYKGSLSPDKEPHAGTKAAFEWSSEDLASLQTDVSLEILRKENSQLQSRVDVLRLALDETKRQTAGLEDKQRDLESLRAKAREAIDRALQEDDSLTVSSTPAARDRTSPPRPHQQDTPSHPPHDTPKPSVPGPVPSTSHPPPSHHAPAPSLSAPDHSFESTPPTSSPEAIMKALGPVPSPLPKWQPPAPGIPVSQPNPFRRKSSASGLPYPGPEAGSWRPYAATEGGALGQSPTSWSGLQGDGKDSSRGLEGSAGGVRVYRPAERRGMPPPPKPGPDAAGGAAVGSWRPS